MFFAQSNPAKTFRNFLSVDCSQFAHLSVIANSIRFLFNNRRAAPNGLKRAPPMLGGAYVAENLSSM
jgi:hypothetical protein